MNSSTVRSNRILHTIHDTPSQTGGISSEARPTVAQEVRLDGDAIYRVQRDRHEHRFFR